MQNRHSACPSPQLGCRARCSYKDKTAVFACNAGGKPAYPFRGTCYDDSPLLYPYSWGKTCINSFPENVIQEKAPSIDFDQSR